MSGLVRHRADRAGDEWRIAQELHDHGADMTVLQRTSTCGVSLEPSAAAVFERHLALQIDTSDEGLLQ